MIRWSHEPAEAPMRFGCRVRASTARLTGGWAVGDRQVVKLPRLFYRGVGLLLPCSPGLWGSLPGLRRRLALRTKRESRRHTKTVSIAVSGDTKAARGVSRVSDGSLFGSDAIASRLRAAVVVASRVASRARPRSRSNRVCSPTCALTPDSSDQACTPTSSSAVSTRGHSTAVMIGLSSRTAGVCSSGLDGAQGGQVSGY